MNVVTIDCNSFGPVVRASCQTDTPNPIRGRAIISRKGVSSRGFGLRHDSTSGAILDESENPKVKLVVNLNERGTMQYEVEWIVSIPEDEHGDADLDNPETKYRRFPTLPLATAFARKVIVGLPFEIAYIRPMREVSRAEIQAWGDCEGAVEDWWQEGGRFYGYVGEAVEVSS